MPRKLPSFLAGWNEYHSELDSPLPFVHWSGLWLQSMAVERRVWTLTKRQQFFPNLFIIVLSPAGFGKGVVFQNARAVAMTLEKPHLGASSMTAAALTQMLRQNDRAFIIQGKKSWPYHSLHTISEEFQTLLPAYDLEILGRLTQLYDCFAYSEERKTGDNSFHCERTCMTLYVCTTPTHLLKTMPTQAWEEGFMSRVFLIYSAEQRDADLFDDGGESKKKYQKLFDDLKHDLGEIRKMEGQFRFTEEAKNLVRAFKRHSPYGGKPIPSHPKLMSYGARRTGHLLKLMMHSGIDRNSKDMMLDEEDYTRAYEWMTTAEASMPEIFKTSVVMGDAEIARDVHHELSAVYVKKGRPIRDRLLQDLLLRHVQAWRIKSFVEMMVNAGYIRQKDVADRGRCWIPITRADLADDD